MAAFVVVVSCKFVANLCSFFIIKWYMTLAHLRPMFYFCNLCKTKKRTLFSDFFGGYRNEKLASNGLKWRKCYKVT